MYIPKKCPNCGANLDPGELCDCYKVETPVIKRSGYSYVHEPTTPNLQVSKTLIIGVDISNGADLSVVSVAETINGSSKLVNIFYGREAEGIYQQLTNLALGDKWEGAKPI